MEGGVLKVPVTTYYWKGGPWQGDDTRVVSGARMTHQTRLVTLEEAWRMGLLELSNGGGAVADAAEQYLALNIMPGNWKLNDNRDPAVRGGYSFGAKNPAGMCVDCSGLISGSFIAAGFDDPNHGNKGSGILNIETNLTQVNYPQRGDVITFRNPKPFYPYHGGIVTNVQSVITGYDRDIPIHGTKVTFIHSSSGNGQIGVGGPKKTTIVIGGDSYYARNLHGFFRH